MIRYKALKSRLIKLFAILLPLSALVCSCAGNSYADPLDDQFLNWAQQGSASPETIDSVLTALSEKTAELTEKKYGEKEIEVEIRSQIRNAGKTFNRNMDQFENEVLSQLDKRRFEQVDDVIARLLEELKGETPPELLEGIEAVVRTGSSGLRWLQIKGKADSMGTYHFLFSDDDISFIGRRAIAVAERFNAMLKSRKLDWLKVSGFDLLRLKEFRKMDLIALDLIDPGKFLGATGLGSIQIEMLEKGAVVAQISGTTVAESAKPLSEFVKAKEARMTAELFEEDALREGVRKYGAFTMVASSERQIATLHGKSDDPLTAWNKLPDNEKAKYILRERQALQESGALATLGGLSSDQIEAQLSRLRELKSKPTIGAEDLDLLVGWRRENIKFAFNELPSKLNPIIESALGSGRSLASHPEVRQAIEELATGFGLMSAILPDSEDEILRMLMKLGGCLTPPCHTDLYKLLYTSFKQSQDLVEVAEAWRVSGKSREEFIELLAKSDEVLKKKLIQMRGGREEISAAEKEALTAWESMVETVPGMKFFTELLKRPAAKKLLVGVLAAPAAIYVIKKMYESYSQGTLGDDISGAAATVIEFVPGGLSVKEFMTNGISGDLALAFVRDALMMYSFPLVLTGDVLVFGAGWGIEVMKQWRYDEMVEALYSGATFEKIGTGKGWRMTAIAYDCPGKGPISLSREQISSLPQACPSVSTNFYPQIKQHPALTAFEDLLKNSAVSTGPVTSAGWPYTYMNLSSYGEKMHELYLKKVDDITLQYFNEVITRLEARYGWVTGTGYQAIIEISRELGCEKPIVEYSRGYLGGDDPKGDADRFQAIVDSYKRLKATNKEITDLGDKWQASFLKGLTPLCTPESIAATEKKAKSLLTTLEKAVADARAEVVALVGENPKDEDLAPPTGARLCMAYNDKASEPYRRCYEEHEAAMAKLKEKAVDLTVAVAAMDEACMAQKVTLGVEYNKPCPDCVITGFQILDESGAAEEQLTPAGAKTTWTPRSAGRKTVQVNVDLVVIKDVLTIQRKAEKPVMIKQEADCPKLAVTLDAGGVTEIGKDDRLTIFVRPVSLAPGNAPISRYFWKEDGVDKPASAEPSYLLSGAGKAGRTVTVTVVARDAENTLAEPASISIAITDSATPAIPVSVLSIDPPPGPDGAVTIRDDGAASLKATVAPKADSGRLRFQWSANGALIDPNKANTDSTIFRGAGWSGKTVNITLVVMDEKNREGRGAITVKVVPATGLNVTFEQHPMSVTERDVMTVRVREPSRNAGNFRYTWTRQGIRGLDNTSFDSLDTEFHGLAGQTLTIRVYVSDDAGRTGFAETSINVTEVKPEDEKIPVSISPPSATVSEDGQIELTISVTPFKDSGQLTLNNVPVPEGTTSYRFTFSGKDTTYAPPVTVPVGVIVKDAKGRTGEAVVNIYVTKNVPPPPPCTYKYSDWGECQPNGTQSRAVLSSDRFGCTGTPILVRSCTYVSLHDKDRDTSTAQPDSQNIQVGEASVPTRDQTNDSGQSVTGTDTADTAKLSFAGAAPDIWEGGNYDNGGERGLYMKRKKASSKGAGQCWDAYVESTIWGKIDPSFAPSTEEEIVSELNRQVAEAKAWGKTGQIRTIAIGDFKGHFMDTSVVFGRGGWSDAGYRGDSVSADGHGYLIKGPQRIELGYSVSGGGCWTSEDQAFLEAQGHAAQDDAKAVLAGLQLVVNGSMAKTPYNGPKLDGSDMPKVTLSPPSLEKLKIGDTVNVQAVVENAKPEDSPFGYTWGGTFDGKPEDMKKTGSVKIKPSKPGKYNLSVSVDGARFNLGSASLAYEVADYKVKIERIPPDNNPVTMGGTVKLKAVLTVDGKETTGNFIFRWQPNTEVTFSNNEVTPDPKLPRNETVATLTKTGRIKIWVEVLDSRGSISSTVATSDQIELEVVQPKLKLTYEPKEPRAGQEVKITVQEDPKMSDNTISFWWEIKGEAVSPGPALNVPNSRAYSFKPKDTRPIIVTVHAKARDGGNDLGSESITIAPQAYTVSVSEPRYLESPPQVWRCDTQLGQAQHCGMVTLKPNEFVVFRDIFLSVTATPKPDSPRYKWTIDPSGSCGSPGIGSEIKLNCSNTGTYTVKVEVTSADSAKLGEASRSVTVSVSQNDLNNSKTAKDAYDKLQKAKEMVAQGKLDEGIPAAEEASKLDPKNTEASGLVTKWKKDRDEIKLHITRMDQLLKDNKIADAEKELQPAQGLHPKYQSVVDAGKRLQLKKQEVSGKQDQAQKLKAEGTALETQGKLQEAINKYKESVGVTPDTSLETHVKQLEAKLQQDVQKKAAAATADTLWQDGMTLFNQKRMNDALAKFRESVKATPNQQRADYVKKLETEQSTAQKLTDEGAALQKQGKLTDASAKYKESIKHWPNPDLEKQIAALDDEAKKKADTQSKLQQETQKREDAQKKAAAATADTLWQDGMTLFNQKRMNDALAKFRESVKATPNQQRADYVKKLETEQSTAQKLTDEGAALQKQGKLTDASAKYKESIKHWPNPDLEKQIAALDDEAKKKADTQSKLQQETQKKATADNLWQEGTALFNQGRPGDALAKFKESLTYWQDGASSKYVLDMEGRRTQAQTLRDQGAQLQQQNRLQDAIAKYNQSLQYWSDSGLKDHIAKIEAEIKKQETQVVTGKPTGSDASNASFPLQVVRNVPNQNSSAFKQNIRKDLSMDTTSWDKIPYSMHVSSHDLMITAPGKFCLAGDAGGTKGWSVDNFLLIEILDQSGNLISSAVAGNMETVRRNGNPAERIGRNSFSFDACEIDVTKLLPVGRPFRLRTSAMDYGGGGYVSDVFIVSSKGTSGTSTPPSAGTWTGTWKSDKRPGKEDVVLVLTQNSNRVTGTYNVDVIMPAATGGQQKTTMSGKLGGTISGNKVNGFFRDRQDKENTATFELTMASDGNSFTVAANSEGKTESWTARRGGSGQATVTPVQPPPQPAPSFDGAYSGPIAGAASGTIQLSVTGDKASGTINGTYSKDRFTGSWSGTVNKTTGEVQGVLKGDVSGNAFTGSVAGRIQGTQASGTWNAKNQYGNPTGTWQATKAGSTSSKGSGVTAGK